MRLLKQTALTGAILGLAACGGGEGGDSNGDDYYRSDYNYHYSMSSPEPGPNRLLVGSSTPIEKSLSFPLSVSYTSEGQSESTFDYSTQIAYISQVAWDNFSWAVDSGTTISTSTTATSSDGNIVAVENGLLVAKNPGKATITYDVSAGDILPELSGSYSGEVIVCPVQDVMLNMVDFTFTDGQTPREFTIVNNQDSGYKVLIANPIIDFSALSNHGLTQDDCPTEIINSHHPYESKFLNAVQNMGNGFSINGKEVPSLKSTSQSTFSQPAELLGLDYSHITLSVTTNDLTNVRVTEAGFDGVWVANVINPIKVMAYSNALQKDVDVSHYYLNDGTGNTGVLGLPIYADGTCHDATQAICITSKADGSFDNLSLTLGNNTYPVDTLHNVETASMPVVVGANRVSLNTNSALPGTLIKIENELLANGKSYDISHLSYIDNASYISGSLSHFSNSGENFSLGNGEANWVFDLESISNRIQSSNLRTSALNVTTGEPTNVNIRGRWVQVDTGKDHWIVANSPNTYTTLGDDQLTYEAHDGTKTLVRASVDSVAVTGSVNVVEEATPQLNSLNRSFSPSARGLSGIGSIDLILKNVNTGEKTEVEVETATGNFSENVPTGIYDVSGTVKDGEISYAVDTQITVEKDATDTGKLNLAKVGLYNFDFEISGCEHDYKCYSGKNYTFTITATNSGYIASPDVVASITDISDNENVASFSIESKPITGAAPGDKITYQVAMSFNKPLTDTVVELPMTLRDSDGRTWEETIHIPLSSHDPLQVNILAYNDNTPASVRGYLMLEGRTPIRVDGSGSTITVPNKAGATYELILGNQEYNQSTPYGVGVATALAAVDFTGFEDISLNEPADDVVGGATQLEAAPTDKLISYISAGDVDYYLISIPAAL